MRVQLTNLLGLRYRLLWAHVRSRKGKTVLFFVAYLLACLIGAFLAMGGFGAAMASIRLGKAELVARIALGGFYMFGIFASVVLGIGVNDVFSDAALRRYPLSAGARLAARHFTAFLEPLWMFLLAFNLGVAVGFYVFGVASLWLAALAAILLVVTNFLLARAIVAAFGWLMASRYAPLGMIGLFGASLGLPPLFRSPSLQAAVAAVFRYTPPFAAASAMAGTASLSSLLGVSFLLLWCAGLAVLLVALDRLPNPLRSVAGVRATWNSPYDRIAALFGPGLAPLIGKTLRYYVRSPHTRHNYPLTLPLLAVMVVTQFRSHGARPMDAFLYALGLISITGMMCTGGLPLNVFGFDGSGFRRYLLQPVAPATMLRATSLTGLIPGATLIPIALLLWLVFPPVPTDARMLAMLASSAVVGWLLYHALGLWTSLLAPRPVEFNLTFGNKFSLAANIAGIGCFLVFFAGLPQGLRALGANTVMRYWWVAPLIMFATIGFYLLSLWGGAGVFAARRERMLSLLEGRG
jgi:hypothetical protein